MGNVSLTSHQQNTNADCCSSCGKVQLRQILQMLFSESVDTVTKTNKPQASFFISRI